jgi:hypothetical protein
MVLVGTRREPASAERAADGKDDHIGKSTNAYLLYYMRRSIPIDAIRIGRSALTA